MLNTDVSVLSEFVPVKTVFTLIFSSAFNYHPDVTGNP